MTNPVNDTTRQAWTKPAIRAVIPVDRTRGGVGDIDDQDDIFYNVS